MLNYVWVVSGSVQSLGKPLPGWMHGGNLYCVSCLRIKDVKGSQNNVYTENVKNFSFILATKTKEVC